MKVLPNHYLPFFTRSKFNLVLSSDWLFTPGHSYECLGRHYVHVRFYIRFCDTRMNRMVHPRHSYESLVYISSFSYPPQTEIGVLLEQEPLGFYASSTCSFHQHVLKSFSNISILLITITYFINGKLIVLMKYLQYLYADNHFMRQTETLNTVQQNANNSLYRHDV